MAASPGMMPLKFVHSAPGTSGVLLFADTPFPGPNGRIIAVASADLTTRARTNVITLPNGVRFDPHQTYVAPRQLGDISFTVAYAGKDSVSDTWIEIQYYLIYQAIGWPGTLHTVPTGGTTITCTARLKEAQTSWSGRKRNFFHDIGPQRQHLTVTFVFDQITDWA